MDLAQIVREEIAEQEISLYRVSEDLGIDPTNLGRFMNQKRDLYLATASKIYEYLGLEVRSTKRKKNKTWHPGR